MVLKVRGEADVQRYVFVNGVQRPERVAFGVGQREGIGERGRISMHAHGLAHIECDRKVRPAALDVEFFLRFDDLAC